MPSAAIRPTTIRYQRPFSGEGSHEQRAISALGHSVVSLRELSASNPTLGQTLQPIIGFLHDMHGHPDQYKEVSYMSSFGGPSRAVGYQKIGDEASPVLYMRYEDSSDLEKGPRRSSFERVERYDVVSLGLMPASEVSGYMYQAKDAPVVTIKRPLGQKNAVIEAGEGRYSPTYEELGSLMPTPLISEDVDALITLVPRSVFNNLTPPPWSSNPGPWPAR